MKTHQLLSILKFIFWVLFIGFLIKAGALVFNFGWSAWNPEGANNIYLGLDLFELRDASIGQFVSVGSLLITIVSLQAYIAYLVIKITNVGDITHPFTQEVAHLISKISHTALTCGIISIIADQYCQRLIKKGFEIPLTWGGKEFLFLAAIIFIISKVFQKGIEIQTENDLTV
ncbi:DUF2975 domain-containing protein [uncultured Dokdonia sp.]|uniref:DUF2975 domain-containing protein n=1 Tax=uncultured Dokdonia sp. TaxID=575653 RepID=UPI0026182DAA|nr:DUF2975 domain-containing protein [uncultured Dokdonia sp.]